MMKANVTSPEFSGDLYYVIDDNTTETVFDEIFGRHHYKEGLDYIKTLEKPIVVDCGAHVGISVLYFDTAPNTTIYALEPLKENYEALCINLSIKPNVKIFNIGLRSFNGSSKFFKGKKGSAGGSILSQAGDEVEINHLNIEEFMKQNAIEHIDLLKIDTEGSEYEILLSQAFKRVEDKIDMIIGEAHTAPIYPGALPDILPNYDVEFLPIKNLSIDITGQLGGEDEPFKLSAGLCTLFVARRKK